MANPWIAPDGARSGSKSEVLAAFLNQTLSELVASCLRGGEVSPRCDVALLGYHGRVVRSLWPGGEADRPLRSITEAAALPRTRREVVRMVPAPDGSEYEMKTVQPVWVEPHAASFTPMPEAFRRAREIVEAWVAEPSHENSYPPIVFHITDGEPQDLEAAIREAEALRAIRTRDGGVLLVTLHIPDAEDAVPEVLFPASEDQLPADPAGARFLYRMSSPLPPELLEEAMGARLPVRRGSRLLLLNADGRNVIRLLNFATVGQTAKTGSKRTLEI